MELTAPIAHVTVFPDRALIQRQGSARLEAGTHALVIAGLPPTLERESVRASGKGQAGARIERLDISNEYHAAAPEAEVRRLQEEVEALGRQLRLLQTRRQALEQQRAWLNQLAAQAATDMARGLAMNRLRPEDCGTFFNFSAEQVRNLDEARLEQDTQYTQLERQLQAKQRELAQVNVQKGTDRLAATVEVTLPEAGQFALELTYVLPGASWTPQYDVRVATEQRQVSLTYQGLVQQKTGEDWRNVALSLSTARPSLVTRVPELNPWYLQVQAPPLRVKQEAQDRRALYKSRPWGGAAGEQAADQPMDMLQAAPAGQGFAMSGEEEYGRDQDGAPPEPEIADILKATVEHAGAALLFHAGRSVDIPSDGAPHTVMIARDDLPCTLDYVSAPILELVAHLRATVRNTTERVLLPGQAHIFHDEAYLGATRLEKIAPGEEFKVFVGIDDRIRIKRELQEKDVDKGSLLQTNLRRITYRYRMQVRNYRQTPAHITLRDRLPVPQHERIKVRVLEIQPQPDERTKLDVLTWEFDLAPDHERAFDVRFSVEYPRDLIVTGLP
jgi:uncharacterized protein (TIGR02231 family)